MRKRKLQKKLNIQVKESNSRKVRVGHCCPSYLAPESSIGAICAQRQEPWPVASAGTWRLLSIGGSRSTLQSPLPHSSIHGRYYQGLCFASRAFQNGWPG